MHIYTYVYIYIYISGFTERYDCINGPMEGRYVTIHRANNVQHLQLCVVKIFVVQGMSVCLHLFLRGN